MSDDKFNGLEEFLEMLMGLSEEPKTEETPKVEHFKAKAVIKGGHYQNTEPSGNSEGKMEEMSMPEHSATEPSGNSEGKMKETPMPEHSTTEPSHYKELAIDPLEYMSVNFTNEAYMGFLEGNILKYVTRYKMKNGVEDLKKARYYLDLLIDRQEMREN